MLLKSFNILKLFGSFSYNISFEKQSNLYIITGPNGYGKTTILTIFHSLCHKEELFYFYDILFESIDINFDNDISLKITQPIITTIKSDDNTIDEKKVIFKLSKNSKTILVYDIDKEKYEKSEYYKKRNNNTENEIFEYHIWSENKKGQSYRIFDLDLNKFVMNLSSLHDTFVHSQRLYTDEYEEKDSSSMISRISEQIKEEIDNMYFSFLQYSQQRDSKFIDQLLSAKKFLNKKDYEAKGEKLSTQIKELVKYDLLSNIVIRPYEEANKKELSVYLNELELKLNIYNALRNKLQLFLKLLENKQFINKRFLISRNNGLRVILTKSNQYLRDLNKLSSGEQNEVILLYKLIFEVPDNTLLLIDEPEISLHVAWQIQFINDIMEIAASRKLQIIIATHSPSIVAQDLDDSIDLLDINTEK